jgi:hypothetical protein
LKESNKKNFSINSKEHLQKLRTNTIWYLSKHITAIRSRKDRTRHHRINIRRNKLQKQREINSHKINTHGEINSYKQREINSKKNNLGRNKLPQENNVFREK